MAPWLAAITDTLEVLHKGDENRYLVATTLWKKPTCSFSRLTLCEEEVFKMPW